MDFFFFFFFKIEEGILCFFFFQAEDGIRDYKVTGVQTCALPISAPPPRCTRTGKRTSIAEPASISGHPRAPQGETLNTVLTLTSCYERPLLPDASPCGSVSVAGAGSSLPERTSRRCRRSASSVLPSR